MNDRSHEVIKQLNRLANDRSLTPLARNKVHEAVRHIKELQHQLQQNHSDDLELADQEGARVADEADSIQNFDSMLPISRAALRAALART